MPDGFDQESIGAALTIDTKASKAAVEELKADIDKLNAAMEYLSTGFRKGSISEDQFLVSSKMVKAELTAKKEILSQVAGDSGFAGIAEGALKAERALNALVSGHGLARAGGMFESVLSAVGGPAGLGFAFVALEMGARVLAPTLEKVGGAITDAHIDNMHRFSLTIAELVKEGEKLSQPAAHPDIEKMVQKYLRDGAGIVLSETIEAAIRDKLTAANKLTLEQQLAGMAPRAEADIAREAATQAAAIMGGISHAEVGALGRAQDLIGQMKSGREQLQELHNRIVQGRLAEEREREKENFVGPPSPNPHEIAQKEKAAREKAERAAHHAQLELDKANDPSNQLRAMQQAEQDALDRQIGQAWNAGGRQETPEQLQMIAQHATANRRLGADIATAVNMAVYQTQEQIMQSFYQMMNPSGNSRQIGGSPY